MTTLPRNRALFLIAGVSGLAFASQAWAQTDDAAPGSGLDEIVVTAQKRAQNLQDVPIAISAISSEKVEQLGIRDSRDLSGLAPNVVITQGTTSNSAAVFSMRGISNGGSESFGVDAANGLYVDGVYIARGGAMGLSVMDIERVEVLRGPQGTLFGRNTTGGAVHFISRSPSPTFRLKAEAGYGNFNAWNGRVTIDPGEIAGISTSFSYSHSERDGVIDNILQPRNSRDPGARRSDAFRAAARLDLGGTGSIQYVFDWNRIKGTPLPFVLTNVADGTPRPPIIVDGQPVQVTQQAPVAQYLAGATFADPDCAALATPVRTYRDEVCNNILSSAFDKSWGHNLQVQNDFGGFKVKSTTGYRFWNSDYVTDLDGIGAFSGPAFSNATLFNGMPEALLQFIPTIPPAAIPFIAASPVPTISQDLFSVDNQRRHKQFSQELEISGDTNTLDWVVGGFYFWEKGSEDGYQNSGFILDTNAIFLANFGPLGPGFAAANPARYRLVQTRARLAYTTSAESTAVYGQATFYPGGRDSGFRLTAGGRYTWDEKKMLRLQNGATLPAAPESGTAKFSKFTWNLMAGYDVADGVNLYARAATGYRSGGFNSQDPAITGTNQLGSFRPEKVTSYEVGLKSELFNRRLRFNVAAYHNIYDDLAVLGPVTDAPVGTFATRIINAGKVVYNGVEVETQAVLSDNFSIDGSLGYIDINYKEFLAGQSPTAGAPPVNIASIVTPGFTSPLTANVALNAQFPLNWGNAVLRGRVGYTHEDGKYNFSSSVGSPFNEQVKGDNVDLVDLQVGIDGIPLGTGEGEVRFWVKNLTNAKDFVRSIDYGPLGFGGGYYAEPRTYGLTVGAKF
ncbi:TonB-dependent receptor [Sphingobium herbicidovorans NBRC 16415]|uniref:TonB-dependent receptor n=1 Tax=Sphingobium herbicidovorans (strain ATCC 700291 / DSM 11019 / CCUG 56400 / KCTC 2939 / LMG 18315 / NBRC 16415 / MH) TaxID=1219045 RepID=A0A086PEX7_SPHHM|nr:TonB-dependent receptor [Sphingobium herbicidovorans]KFG91945.1 TonB-dependent receptor [Sphingobium herbicidovorans NBRC 16415]